MEDNADGSHRITFNVGYTAVTSTFPVDLTKGFRWNYENAQFGLHLSFKESMTADAAPFQMTWLLNETDVAKDLMFYPNGSTVGVTSRNDYTGLNFSVGDSATTSIEMVFRREEISGAVYYKLYMNDAEAYICYPEAVFKALNHYNEVTEKFEGAYIGVANEGAALSLSLTPNTKEIPVVKTFEGFGEGQGTVEDNADGSHRITFNVGYTAVTSTYKIDLTKGFRWNYEYAQFGLHLKFKQTKDAEPTPFQMTWLLNETDVATDLLFYPNGSAIGVASRNDYTGLNFNIGDSAAASIEMVFRREEINGSAYYKLYMNDAEAFVCYPEATFKALNHYNEVTEKFEGAYIGVSNEGAALSLSLTPNTKEIPVVKTFEGFGEGQGTVEDNADGSHRITFNVGYTAVASTYKIDLTKGFRWNYENAQFGLHLSFKQTKDAAATPFQMTWLLNETDVAKDLMFYPNGSAVGVTSRNDYTGLNFNIGDFAAASIEMVFRREEINGSAYYKLYMNDAEAFICYPEATFKALNHYNAATGEFEGAYIGVANEGVALSLSIEPITDRMLGDVNGDDTVDVRDLVCLDAYLADPETGILAKNSDLDLNGCVDAEDLALLRKLLLGVITVTAS